MDKEFDLASLKRRYMLDIELYERTYDAWHKRGKKVVKRYRDERNELAEATGTTEARYNILWANVQTVVPAVFARLPKPEVTRRHKDKDPVARVASMILERALQYEIEQYTDYSSAVLNSVEDRVLPGRGISWVRYNPVMKSLSMPSAQITEDVPEAAKQAGGEQPGTAEVIDYECSPVDYVHWEDFGHNVARTWEEVYLVWRIVPLDRKELIKRFGEEKGKQIALDMKSPLQDEALATPEGESLKKARIYEVWDKKAGLVVWLSKSSEEALDAKRDPLGLEAFFPCPKPIYSTVTTNSLIPVPDYCLYQDQAKELDLICERIEGLTEALKVAGVYDSSQDGIKRLFTEGGNTQLIPVDTWAAFAEKGGIKGVMDFVPLDQIVQALNALYLAREQAKAVIYEVSGIADVIRGASDPNETATAIRTKGQYASLRLKKMQASVAEFATELLRIKAQIICKHYQPETIVLIAGVEQMTEQDKQLVPQAIELLRNEPMRGFRIDISSDSLLEVDEQQEKQDRMEFITAVGGFVQQALSAPPEIAPLLGEVLLFAVRGFKAGRSLEGAFEEAIEKLRKKAEQPPGPDAEQQKLQMEQALAQAKLEGEQRMEQFRQQAEEARHQREMQMEHALAEQKMAMEERVRMMEAAMDERFERWKAELEAATKIETANIASKAKVDNEATQAATGEIASEVQQ
jgi:hypothetical protein